MTDTTITSTFYEKIASACRKKEALFDENLGRYALRSMFAGAYLTMSTAVGVVAADVISQFSLAFGRFAFAFIFSFGLVYVLLFNGELAVSDIKHDVSLFRSLLQTHLFQESHNHFIDMYFFQFNRCYHFSLAL